MTDTVIYNRNRIKDGFAAVDGINLDSLRKNAGIRVRTRRETDLGGSDSWIGSERMGECDPWQ